MSSLHHIYHKNPWICILTTMSPRQHCQGRDAGRQCVGITRAEDRTQPHHSIALRLKGNPTGPTVLVLTQTNVLHLSSVK